jgi:hypothetical protein
VPTSRPENNAAAYSTHDCSRTCACSSAPVGSRSLLNPCARPSRVVFKHSNCLEGSCMPSASQQQQTCSLPATTQPQQCSFMLQKLRSAAAKCTRSSTAVKPDFLLIPCAKHNKLVQRTPCAYEQQLQTMTTTHSLEGSNATHHNDCEPKNTPSTHLRHSGSALQAVQHPSNGGQHLLVAVLACPVNACKASMSLLQRARSLPTKNHPAISKGCNLHHIFSHHCSADLILAEPLAGSCCAVPSCCAPVHQSTHSAAL